MHAEPRTGGVGGGGAGQRLAVDVRQVDHCLPDSGERFSHVAEPRTGRHDVLPRPVVQDLDVTGGDHAPLEAHVTAHDEASAADE